VFRTFEVCAGNRVRNVASTETILIPIKSFADSFPYLVNLAPGPKMDSAVWGCETNHIPASSRSRFEARPIERRSQAIIVIFTATQTKVRIAPNLTDKVQSLLPSSVSRTIVCREKVLG
jgi:hypothetical protein